MGASCLLEQPATGDALAAWARQGLLYAALDPSADAAILNAVALDAERARVTGTRRFLCLYQGVLEARLWDVAPRLVALDPAALSWWGALPRHARGTGIVSAAGVEHVYAHLRTLLVVQLPSGVVHFRLCDSGAVRSVLTVLRAPQLEQMLGPIGALVLGDVAYSRTAAGAPR